MLIMQLLNYSVKSSTLGGNNNDNGVFSGVTKYTAISLPVPARHLTLHLLTSGNSDKGRYSKSQCNFLTFDLIPFPSCLSFFCLFVFFNVLEYLPCSKNLS